MLKQTTIDLINDEFRRLSLDHNTPIPPWRLIDGNTSAFLRDQGSIEMASGSLHGLEQLGDVVDMVGLVAHEFRHYWQWLNHVNDDKPQTREANARRFSRQWTTRRFPQRVDELNFQGLNRGMDILPPGPGLEDGMDKQTISETIQQRASNLTELELSLVEEAFKPRGRPVSTSKWIRIRLFRGGPGHSYGMWREFTDVIHKLGYKAGSYDTFRTLMWVLDDKLGFIKRLTTSSGVEVVEESDFGEPRHPYEIVPKFQDDERWSHPIRAVYG